MILKDKSRGGTVVDYLKYQIVVNGVLYFFAKFLSFLCETACFNLRNERKDVIVYDVTSIQP